MNTDYDAPPSELPALQLHRGNFTITDAVNEAVRLFQANWLPLTAAGAVMMVIPFTAQMLVSVLLVLLQDLEIWLQNLISVAVNIPIGFLSLGMTLGSYRVVTDLTSGRPASFDRYFEAMLRIPILFGQYFVLILVAGVALAPLGLLYFLIGDHPTLAFAFGFTFLLLFIAAYFYVLLGVLFVPFELAYDPSSGFVSSVTRSWAIAKGRRLQIAGMMAITSLVSVLGFVMCCVGLIPASGFSLALLGVVYSGLRTGLIAPPEEPQPGPDVDALWP